MDKQLMIQRVAVLGAGVMGAQIAAHFVNAGFEVLLYDLAAQTGDANAIVDKAIKHLTKLKPTPLATPAIASYIHPKNYQQDLVDLKSCDLIIEAVAERFDIKQSLYEQIVPYVSKHSVLVSNTSGLSINKLSELLPEDLRSRFCGVHFFNPPRYMHLLELIPAKSTVTRLLDELESFFVSFMGKGVVRAKDTPNFIANRIGVFSMLATIYHAERLGISFEVVDALTGTLLGRPKSATFRTMDVVGLDTMAHVVETMKQNLGSDPWHKYYQLPSWFNELIEGGALGQKTRAGIYKKEGKTIKVWHVETKAYVEQKVEVDPEIKQLFKSTAPSELLFKLRKLESKQAQFLWACYQDLFHYCAFHLKDIAQTPRDIDLAIRWGFGWQQGPFESWQQAGVLQINQALSESISKGQSMVNVALPQWLTELDYFYKAEGAIEPSSMSYLARSSLAVYQRQLIKDPVLAEVAIATHILYQDEAVQLSTFDEQVAVLSFKSKANAIGEDVLDGMMKALDLAEQKCKALVLWQQSPLNFSVGANLKQFIASFAADKSDELKAIVYKFQRVALRLKYCQIPTVAALRGRALGGGCEFLMHCDEAVAALESYVGLVEVGVGLLPAGGGLKELALRAQHNANGLAVFPLLEKYFKMVAMAEVAGSAVEAKEKAFLKASTQIVMNTHEVLYRAIEQAKFLALNNYLPPRKPKIAAQGREALARLNMLITNMAEGGFISEHDQLIAEKIAYVLCGGDLNEGELVDEEWFLRLEIEAFIELAKTEKTQARVQHLLETGKPLRN